jgi:hypothetical protein
MPTPIVRSDGVLYGRVSKLPEDVFVLFVGTNPEPRNLIMLKGTECPMVLTYSDCVDGRVIANLLESKTWMVGILLETLVSTPGTFLNFLGNPAKHSRNWRVVDDFKASRDRVVVSPRRCSASASRASRDKASGDFSNSWLQRRSDASSANNHRANSSCASSGSCPASLKASSSNFVMGLPPHAYDTSLHFGCRP